MFGTSICIKNKEIEESTMVLSAEPKSKDRFYLTFQPRTIKIICGIWIYFFLWGICSIISFKYSPFFSGNVEDSFIRVAGNFYMFFLIFNFAIAKFTNLSRFWPVWTIGIICSLLIFLLHHDVRLTRDRLLLECNGTIVDKYISDNHMRKRLIVEGKKTAILEGLSHELWKSAKIGDKIKKSARNPFVLLNGKSVRMIDEVEYMPYKGKLLPKSAFDQFKKT